MPLAFVIVAVIFFVIAASAWKFPTGSVAIGWLGLAFWALSTIFGKLWT